MVSQRNKRIPGSDHSVISLIQFSRKPSAKSGALARR
jgi:hypothetical protein